MSVVISLCDLTGHMVQPWVEAGYRAILVDPQHGVDSSQGRVTKLARTVEQAIPFLVDEFYVQCRTIGRLSGAPWFVENPVSVLSRVFGKPQHIFDPCDYTEFEPSDNYTKRTCLWTGGGFVMPEPARDLTLGAPDDRIHKAAPGPDRENFRSATPLGFARAVFQANARKEMAA